MIGILADRSQFVARQGVPVAGQDRPTPPAEVARVMLDRSACRSDERRLHPTNDNFRSANDQLRSERLRGKQNSLAQKAMILLALPA
jgi:hypothetical protein